MVSMRYAEVAVDAAVAHSRTFSYSIPPRFSVETGQLVWVPFGRRVLQGLVVELVDIFFLHWQSVNPFVVKGSK